MVNAHQHSQWEIERDPCGEEPFFSSRCDWKANAREQEGYGGKQEAGFLVRKEGEEEDAEESGEGGCGGAKEGEGGEQEEREVDQGVSVERMCAVCCKVRR